jgi:hypothetical protein
MLLNTTAKGATTPSFAPQQTFTVGNQHVTSRVSLAVADLNGDGKPDLIATSSSDETVSVLLNTTAAGATTATFAARQTFAIGTGDAVAAADVNGDGKPDVITLNGDGTVSVFPNTTPTGAATASFAAQQTFATSLNPFSLAVGDFNGDGKPDLAVVNGNTVSVLRNTTATAAAPPHLRTPAEIPHRQ